MSGRSPTFSVIVPTFARPWHLDRCLASLARQDHDSFEVIVVDDGSPESLDDVVARHQKRAAVTLIRQENAGPAAARNRGVEGSSGAFLAFTDDDCRPHRNWLSELETVLRAESGALVGGQTVNRLTRNPFSEASQVIMEIVYTFYNPSVDEVTFLASNNLAAHRAGFEEVGGFDPMFFRSASEDRELCDRWLHRGGRMALAPAAVIHHVHNLSLPSFMRQHFVYGRGAWRYQRTRAERGSGRLRDDLPFHLRLPSLARGPLSRRSPGRVAALLPLLAIWLVVNTSGFVYEGLTGGGD